MRHLFLVCAYILLGYSTLNSAWALDYPNRPLRLIVGYPPGGAGDTVARFIAGKYSEQLKQPVVVENKPGATATIAAGIAAKAVPDGYTLYQSAGTEFTVAPTILGDKLSYVWQRDFQPIGLLVLSPGIFVVSSSSPFRSIEDLIKHAKSKPNTLNFANFGSASTSFMANEAFKNAANLSVSHVPFKGSGPALIELFAGRVDLFADTVANASPMIQSGRLRALAVTTPQRSPLLPSVPSMEELGFKNFSYGGSIGIVVPIDTPAPIASKLTSVTQTIMKLPEVQNRFSELGFIPMQEEGAAYFARLNNESERLAKIIRSGNITMD
jgi:tripartite-type tricarboxylate transporter receptor subunit TctC